MQPPRAALLLLCCASAAAGLQPPARRARAPPGQRRRVGTLRGGAAPLSAAATAIAAKGTRLATATSSVDVSKLSFVSKASQVRAAEMMTTWHSLQAVLRFRLGAQSTATKFETWAGKG